MEIPTALVFADPGYLVFGMVALLGGFVAFGAGKPAEGAAASLVGSGILYLCYAGTL